RSPPRGGERSVPRASVARSRLRAAFPDGDVRVGRRSGAQPMTPLRNAVRGVPAAFAFLTRLPVGGFPYTLDELRWSSAHFPLVGAALGATLAGVMLISRHAGSVVAAALAVSVGMLLTGALHEDGLAATGVALG